MLGRILLDYGHQKKAYIHADASEKLAVDAVQKAISLGLKANLALAIGDKQSLINMRRIFERAIDVLEKSHDLQASTIVTLEIYVDWFATELNTGDCSEAKFVMSKISNNLKLDAVFPQTRVEMKRNVWSIFRNAKRDCDLTPMEID